MTTNPFPGMNPFMEQTWPDVHLRLIGLILTELGVELPEDLVAKAEEQVDVFTTDGEPPRATRPDVAVVDIAESWERGLPPVWTPTEEANALIVTEPTMLVAEAPPHRWVEIRTDRGKLVTVIEVLSPANKTTHREAYRTKRRAYVAGGVNVVEIDLLRGGRRIADVDDYGYDTFSARLGEHFLICASRSVVPGRREVYASALRKRLPVIRIPLRATDPDVPLDIQALVDRCYTTGRYWKLDYTRSPIPPLPEADSLWVSERLAAAGLRV